MGKKKERPMAENSNSFEIDSHSVSDVTQNFTDAISKKNKKHKRKKSSKKEKRQEKIPSKHVETVETLIMEEDDQDIMVDDIDVDIEDSLSEPTSCMKLTVKTPDSASEKSSKIVQKTKSEKNKSVNNAKKSTKKKDGTKGDDDTDSEEERWLDAIESGKLEEVDDELKRIKNPRLMTARQRALMEKRSDGFDETFPTIPAEPLLALPTGFKEKVLTDEMLAKKAIKSKRRREQAIEKREEDKKKTVDRLLKKQDSKSVKAARSKGPRKVAPPVTYLNNRHGTFLCFPHGGDPIPIAPLIEREVPKPIVCGVDGCCNLKKYSCSKTQVPLCSLECYKKNLLKFTAVLT